MDDGVVALDPDTGRLQWQQEKVFNQRCVSSPIIAAGLIVGSCGSGAGGNYVAAVRPPDPARGTSAEVAYTIRKSAPYVPSGLAVGNLLFLWGDAGMVTCADARSGQIKWQERTIVANFFASPICIDGRLFNVSSSGELVVLEASEKFRELARNDLHESTHATPAVSGGRLYLRTLHHLVSVGGREGQSR
jgi:outer membrane protein assembly factor BamB